MAHNERDSASSKDAMAADFVISKGLTSAEAAKLLEQWGRNELEEKSVPKWLIFLQQLWAPMPIMIWIAALTEAAIQNWPDMAILLGIQFANASIGFYEITKAGDAVAALKNSLKPSATVKRDGKWGNIDAATCVPGDLVLLAAGSAIPADCIVNHGTIDVDQAALTGESLPVQMFKGSKCMMGSNVVRGEVEGTVEFTGSNTFFGKTASLLQGDQEVGNLQKILMTIMMVLVVISFVLSGIVFIVLLTSNEGTSSSISFTVVLIVASIPIAIEIVCTTTLALGSKELSKHGAIVTRLAAIEDLAGMNMLCSDKTGTLTLNKMVIQDETPIYKEGETQYSILRQAAMAAKWHEPPRDALDTMVLTKADLKSLDDFDALDFMPFDPVVKRTEGTVLNRKTQQKFQVTKGAPHVLLKLTKNQKVIDACHHDVEALGKRGIRSLAVARKNLEKDEWEMLGLLTFLDPPRPDTKETIHRAISYGVEVKMITGDHLLIAMETARALDLGDRIPGRPGVVPIIRGPDKLPMLDAETKKAPPDMAKNFGDYIRQGHGFAQVFPEHKFLIVQCLRELGFKCGMTGDGVNDAPALKRADVGIAVAGATDAARAAADIVLTEEGLSTIIEGIIISRCIFQRMKNFITYRIAATLQLLVFFFIAVLALRPRDYEPSNWSTDSSFISANIDDSSTDNPWPAFFKMPVLLLMLITLLNDGTLISIGYDYVVPSKYPNEWNLPVLFTVSSVLAAIALISSIILLALALSSWDDNSFFNQLGIGGLTYGQISTLMYLKVSISDFLTLFSARTHDGWFWSSYPSPILLGAACLALTLSTILACVWPKSTIDGQKVEGLALISGQEQLFVYVWIYCIFWWFVQDGAKVACYYILEKYNMFGINDTLKLGKGVNQLPKVTGPSDQEEGEATRGSVSGRVSVSGSDGRKKSSGHLVNIPRKQSGISAIR